MATPSSKFSKTLQSLTQSKIRELEKQRLAYESAKSIVLTTASQKPDIRDKVQCILSGAKVLLPDVTEELKVSNIERWLDQALYDSSIPTEKLKSFEEVLISALDAHSLKLNIVDLYSQLLTEWMDSPAASDGSVEDSAAEGDFEVIEERQKRRLQELCDHFEGVVFESVETSEEDTHAFLDTLFPNEDSVLALATLRDRVMSECSDLWSEKSPFNAFSLRSCIQGLLTEDLLNEEKQDILKYFDQNDIALTEVADVLNMRYAGLKNWDWHAEEGIPVLPRQQLNGKYRIWIDDDALQTLFVQYIAVRLCNLLKNVLKETIEKSSVWNWHPSPRITERDALRRHYYMSSSNTTTSIETSQKKDYLESDFVLHMPLSMASLSERALPHSTILAVMTYFGIPEEWIAFFRKYLEAPLNMDNSADRRKKAGPRTRKRGVPIAHAIEKLAGELVLFPMDLAVNRETGLLLYRIHDDLWVCGEPEKCAKAWEVDAHVFQLQNQLSGCESVISWVWTWNSCIGRFFKNTFGKPAHCFGRAHIDAILSTYEKMQDTLFNAQIPQSGRTVTEHLRDMIESRFGFTDIPDAFFFAPAELGGLGLRNPFLSVLLMRNSTHLSPVEQIEKFKKEERGNSPTRRKPSKK
ncbi:hypothetical protein BBP40_009606 [Aspergillus hancockii]|nr:hypothetical protein BBP40_009606 [Aspergillus hancockii]